MSAVQGLTELVYCHKVQNNSGDLQRLLDSSVDKVVCYNALLQSNRPGFESQSGHFLFNFFTNTIRIFFFEIFLNPIVIVIFCIKHAAFIYLS